MSNSVFHHFLVFVAALLSVGSLRTTHAETVNVKYQGPVNLTTFQCESFYLNKNVNRVCYDQRERYMVILLHKTYYHYCEIDSQTVFSLKKSSMMDQFFSSNIRGNFGCRDRKVPEYK